MDVPLHEDFLKKEEEKEKWVEYWVILRNCVLYFYDEKTDLWHEYCDKIDITANSRCAVVKRKTYSHRFKLVTEEGTCLLKCHTNLQRHRWMHAIELAVREISSKATDLAPVATTPRGCYYERDLFGRSMRREMRQQEAARQNNNNTLEELSLNLDLEKEGKRERQTSRKSSKLQKSAQRDKDSSIAFESLQCDFDPNLGSPVENLAFSDDEVSVDGNIKMRSIRSAPVAKFIRVGSASKPI
ncbi:uncharacterized protein LOC144651895 [Oculina patagonica]